MRIDQGKRGSKVEMRHLVHDLFDKNIHRRLGNVVIVVEDKEQRSRQERKSSTNCRARYSVLTSNCPSSICLV